MGQNIPGIRERHQPRAAARPRRIRRGAADEDQGRQRRAAPNRGAGAGNPRRHLTLIAVPFFPVLPRINPVPEHHNARPTLGAPLEPRAAIARDPPKEDPCLASSASWRSRRHSRARRLQRSRQPGHPCRAAPRPAANARPPRSERLARRIALALADAGFRACSSSRISTARRSGRASSISSATSPRPARAPPGISRGWPRANPTPWSSSTRGGPPRSSCTSRCRPTAPPGPETTAFWSPPWATSASRRSRFPRRASASSSARTSPPDVPVLALVPVETDFDQARRPACRAVPPAAGLRRHPDCT